MNDPAPVDADCCDLCAPSPSTSGTGTRCAACVAGGDMVSQVVWGLVRTTVEDAAPGQRVTFMLTGLSAHALEGIARNAPDDIAGRSLLLRMNPQAAPRLRVDAVFLSTESAVHWRHNDDAEVIVFAPSDEEREGIGAGLGPIARIDEQRIVDQAEAWVDFLDETGEARSYLRAALAGLRDSKVYLDLRMWVDFVAAIQAQGFALSPELRVKHAMPALRIPRDGITKLPTFKAEGNPKARPKAFATAFLDARLEAGSYVDLMTPKHERVDVGTVRKAVDEYPHDDEPEVLDALDAVRALLDDATNIRPGGWRPSQSRFCSVVSWERIGAALFGSGRRPPKESLGERTLNYIQGNFGDEVTKEDRELLESMTDKASGEPSDAEVEFFNCWQERLNHPKEVKLFKGWQKRLFSKEVIGHDLISTFAEGFEALIIAGAETLGEMSSPRILVRTTQHNKARFWEALDPDVLRLFRFELLCVRALFGEHVAWDLEAAFNHELGDPSQANEARRIDLELYLVEADDLSDLGGLRTPPKSAPRVKATWQPGVKPKDEPISLALVEDLEALGKAAANGHSLFRSVHFAARATGDDARVASISLKDRNSFSDVAGRSEGRTFEIAVRSRDDLLGEVRTKLSELESHKSIDLATAGELRAAIDTFETTFRSVLQRIAEDPAKAFVSRDLDDQADAFGALCRACRLPAGAGKTGQELRALVARIAVIASEGAESMAILAAWHPLRLAERKAKIRELAAFVEAILTSRAAMNADLTVAFQERRLALGRWVFPEVALVDDTTMIAVEDWAGYSLMVPADCVSRSQEALEASAPSAAQKFMEGVDQYLDVHPHEATNLSAAIFDSESQTLPREVAREMAKRLHRRPDLRCDLVITHTDQARMRKIFRHQNTRLASETITETARGFLSRLRVDVRPNKGGTGADGVRDMDLVVLHDVVSHHATPTWEAERSASDELDSVFDPSIARRPRRRMTETDASGVGVYLTLPRPPRAVAEYHDMLYELAKDAFLPAGFHGVLIRQVEFDNPDVQRLIQRAHDLGEWVITYDKVSSRALLERCGVQIISDISVPGSEGRVIISAGKVDDRLKANVRDDLNKACGFDADQALAFTEIVIRDVLKISGQKVLSAARYANASREMIGLAVMRAQMEAALKTAVDTTPIWISLDDYRGWFASTKGKVADAVGVAIEDGPEGFRILIQVGEAKFVEKSAETETLKEAQQQVRHTVERLVRIFVDNDDRISRAAWCSRLADLLVNRDGVTERLPDPARRAAFFDALGAGQIRFELSGEAVVCLHDDHGPVSRTDHDLDRRHLRHHLLTTPAIRRTLQLAAEGKLPERDELRDVVWYAGSDQPARSSRLPVPAADGAASQVPQGPAPDQAGKDLADGRADVVEDQEPATEISAQDQGNDGQEQEAPATSPAPRFLPEPIASILQEMAAGERGAIADEASLAWAEEVSKETQRALSHFSMQAEFADPKLRLTPNGALIAFRGHPTLTTEKIEKRRGELLTTYGIEVADVRPGRGKISVFVTREKRATVPLASTWLGAPWPDREPGSLTSFIVGAREDDDHLLHLNLAEPFAGYEAHGPHTLIAGETGSGKGILTQSLLLQLIAFNDPREAELILVDPKKGVDFTWLNGAPHMKGAVITEMADAEGVLDDLVLQMDERYDRLASVGAANIAEYNRKVSPANRMSRAFLVHDELGAWMAQEKDYQEVVLSAVANLGMKARAAGIHLILITQRADADAVPGRLRDNMGNRLCLKVQNGTGSRMVLGVGGAEKLLGKGHLACVLANQPTPPGQEYFLVQVPFAEFEDMRRLAEAAKAYWRPSEAPG